MIVNSLKSPNVRHVADPVMSDARRGERVVAPLVGTLAEQRCGLIESELHPQVGTAGSIELPDLVVGTERPREDRLGAEPRRERLLSRVQIANTRSPTR